MYSAFCQQLHTVMATQTPQELTLYVAYSGGLDSSVLLDLAARYACEFQQVLEVIHINHGLSEFADEWQAHCQRRCQQLGVKLHCRQLNITATGLGVERAAREARYQALAEVIAEFKSNTAWLLTGQHRDDQVETFLLQLKRGSGIKGLAAMPAVSQFKPQIFNHSYLIRPLLECRREQLHSYAEQQQLDWVEDPSNVNERFDRNFLRQSILPLLKQRWPHFDVSVCRTVQHIQQQQQLIEELSQADLATCLETNGSLFIQPLLGLSPVRRNNLLRYWFAQHHVPMPSQRIMKRIYQELLLARVDAQPQVSWRSVVLRRFRQGVYLTHLDEDLRGEDQLGVTITQSPAATNLPLFDANGRQFALLTLTYQGQGGGLRLPINNGKIDIRFARHGEFNQIKYQCDGDQHHQTLSQLFKQYAIPPWQRCRVPLIYLDEQLVAVADWIICQSEVKQYQELSTFTIDFSILSF